MKKIVALLLCLSMTGCATIFTKGYDTVSIHSRDPEADILVNGNVVGKGQAVFPVKKGQQALLTASKKGCQDRTIATGESMNKVAILNLLFIIGWIIDAATGKLHKTDPMDYTVTPACP